MPTSEQQTMGQKAAALVESLFSLVITPLAAPVRAMHLTIGHSTVSAGLLIAIAIVGGSWINAHVFSSSNTSIVNDGRTWNFTSMRTFNDRIEIDVPKIGNKLLIAWKPTLTKDGGSIVFFDILEDESDFQTFILPSSIFGASWVSGTSIAFDMKQIVPGGRDSIYELRRRIVDVP